MYTWLIQARKLVQRHITSQRFPIILKYLFPKRKSYRKRKIKEFVALLSVSENATGAETLV